MHCVQASGRRPRRTGWEKHFTLNRRAAPPPPVCGPRFKACLRYEGIDVKERKSDYESSLAKSKVYPLPASG